MKRLVMIALALSLLAGCAIVPLEPFNYGRGYPFGYYDGHRSHDRHRGYDGRRYDGDHYRGYGYGYPRGY